MSYPKVLTSWMTTVSRHLPHLSLPQATGVALFSYGMVLAQSCGLVSVATVLVELLGGSFDAMRERLRDVYRERGAKKGDHRRDIDVTVCFADLMTWILSLWPATNRQIALAMDATTLSNRFTVLSIHVLVQGCSIPVAWVVLHAGKPGAWETHWRRLFNLLNGSIPADWTVTVCADRGLYAKWLYDKICALGWHPYLRINMQGYVRPEGTTEFVPLSSLVPTPGTCWVGAVTCFMTAESQLSCTLLARWDADYADPWLIVTDLSPDATHVAWYGMRAWIEGGYKDMKRGGWHWEQTKMDDPERVSRLWLVMAVATLMVVNIGCVAEVADPTREGDEGPETHVADQPASDAPSPRQISCFRRGVLIVVGRRGTDTELPLGQFAPEPWAERGQHEHPPPRARPKHLATPWLRFVLLVLVVCYLQAMGYVPWTVGSKRE